MDTTPEYIKKCEKSWPDLEIYCPVFSRRLRMLYILDGKWGRWGDIVNDSNYKRAFPLWEQDQLQEMVTLDQGSSPFGKLCRFGAFVSNNPVVLQLPSFEQMWLYYVMRWEFGKVWGGEEWVKEK